MAELISIVVTAYNREDALDAVLRSLARQDDRDFEIVVADDGSGPATAQLVEAWKATIGHRVEHIWHEDNGFRAAEIHNRAILASHGAYVIFLDGDCIVRPDFVATHRRLAQAGWFVTGYRILLSPQLTERVLRDKLTPETWSFAVWIAQRLRGGINRLSALLRLPLGPLRWLRRNAWRGARSANLTVWRSDLTHVDGFDADYSGWGKEDSDIIGAAAARQREAEGRHIRYRRAASLARRSRPLPAAGERGQGQHNCRRRNGARAARALRPAGAAPAATQRDSR